jgi:hypothetical protein
MLIIQFYVESLRDFGVKFDLETLYETVQNFIDNQTKIFKLDLVLNNVEGMEETRKLQDLYRAIPDDEETDEKILEKAQKCRIILNEVTTKAFGYIKESHSLLEQLFDRMIFYYEKIIPSPENNKRAMEIYKHLVAIKKLYIHMKTRILAQPTFKSYIQGDNTLDEFPAGITAADAEKYSNQTIKLKAPYWDKGEKGSLVAQAPAEHDVPLSALKDVASFKDFMKNVLHCPEKSIDQQMWQTYNAIRREAFYATEASQAPVQSSDEEILAQRI